jgi:peptidoglycan/xylan/chitin deacetylase (PgdA/CDA1 family)
VKLTILMYHKIDEPPAGVRTPGNFVTPERFAAQIDALVGWGYTTITFDQWLDHVNGLKVPMPARPLILTFDDGYTCFADTAWPVLRARRMGATVFLVTSQIGGTNVWDRDEVRLPLLDAERIRALQAEGVHFGSHSRSHRPLAELPRDEAFDELVRSRWALAELLDREVDTFAYPFSNQNADVRALARQAGYRCAVRGKGRMNSRRVDPFGLRRIKVEPEMTAASLGRVLTKERYLRPF